MMVQHHLYDTFKARLSQKITNIRVFDEGILNHVYEEFTNKLCNTRIQGFISATKQQMATNKGTASTVDINLHTSLLTHHTKLTTKLGSAT